MMRLYRCARSLLWLLLLLLGVANHAFAGLFCTEFPLDPSDSTGNTRLIEGTATPVGLTNSELYATWQDYFAGENITQVTVDTSCTFRNWDPLSVTINFQAFGSDKPAYLVMFDNVNFTGNMSCGNNDHLLYFVNSPPPNINPGCQDLVIPVEGMQKLNPAGKTTVGLGETFTYTLRIPTQYIGGVQVDPNGTDVDISDMVIKDNLNTTGANLTYVSSVIRDEGGTPLTAGVDYIFTNSAGLLTFDLTPMYSQSSGKEVLAGDQIEIDITVNVNSANTSGAQIVNTATWTFSRVFRLDNDGDGIFDDIVYDPIVGQNAISEPLTIGAPDLKMDKRSLDTTLPLGGFGNFILDVQNIGNTDAWETTIVDQLPRSATLTASMCNFDPTATVTAGIYEANGSTLVNALTAGVDYTVVFDNSLGVSSTLPCLLTLTLSSAKTVIAPSQRLIINYQAQLDPGD